MPNIPKREGKVVQKSSCFSGFDEKDISKTDNFMGKRLTK